jgi:hypothetical protein
LTKFFSEANLQGIHIDKTLNQVTLMGEKQSSKSSIRVCDFAAAMLIVYEDPYSQIAFSLDPANPLQPDGPMFRKVYWPDSYLPYSTIGAAMFEADWFL